MIGEPGMPGKSAQAAGQQDHAGTCHEGGAGQGEGVDRQYKDGPPSRRGQARDAGCETQLNLIRQRAFRPHCPARLANARPAHAPFASLMAVGWRALNFSRAKVTR
jgi:hypothetical protein